MFKKFNNLFFKYFLSLFFIFLLVIPVWAEDSRIKIPEDKSLYLMVSGGARVGRGKHGMPLNRLIKFNLGRSDHTFQEIKTFTSSHAGGTKVYPEFKFLTIHSTNSLDDDYNKLYIIPTNKPWEYQIYKKFFNEYLYPQKINNQDYMVSLKFNSVDGGLEPETSRINLSNLKKEEVPLDILKDMNTRRWLSVKEGELYVDSSGLDHIKMPYNVPDELNELEEVHLIYNSKKYFVLRSPYHGENSWIYKLDKEQNKWTKFVVTGDESYIKVMNDYIVVQIGYDQGGYPTKMIGDFEIINLKSGEKQILDLDGLTKILIFDDNYLIVKDDHELLYIPVENGNIKNEDAITLYKEKERSWREKVLYIDAAFLGPKEIPEEVKIQRAIELNTIGEEYYHEAYYQLGKAIYYFKEAIKFNPEYALAYSNLGLAYYTAEEYDESIKSSLKAIELT
ncbi:MAG: tetratricopeptide repeat protein, partial [bacterium]